jgi:hypothetical protein
VLWFEWLLLTDKQSLIPRLLSFSGKTCRHEQASAVPPTASLTASKSIYSDCSMRSESNRSLTGRLGAERPSRKFLSYMRLAYRRVFLRFLCGGNQTAWRWPEFGRAEKNFRMTIRLWWLQTSRPGDWIVVGLEREDRCPEGAAVRDSISFGLPHGFRKMRTGRLVGTRPVDTSLRGTSPTSSKRSTRSAKRVNASIISIRASGAPTQE